MDKRRPAVWRFENIKKQMFSTRKIYEEKNHQENRRFSSIFKQNRKRWYFCPSKTSIQFKKLFKREKNHGVENFRKALISKGKIVKSWFIWRSFERKRHFWWGNNYWIKIGGKISVVWNILAQNNYRIKNC